MITTSRAQRFVRFLSGERGEDLKNLRGHARTEALPGLLQRNGLLQTMLFLEAKEEKDRDLTRLLREAVQAIVPQAKMKKEELGRAPVEEYLFYSELALEAATWIMRLAKAQEAQKKHGLVE